MGRLILVSNRLPVTVRRRRSGGMEIVRSSGGLVAALGPLHERGDGLWIGNLGDRPVDEVRNTLLERRFIPVPVSQAETRGYYLGYANSALWPLFHYLPERAQFESSHYETYRRVNRRFAEYVAECATEDDLIWVHDYQLMLVPRMLRRKLPKARIGFFLHTPFPSSEMFRILPQSAEILRGLIGADVIGLHTYDYARHLVSSLLRVLGVHGREGVAEVDGRQVQIATQPIGIDVDTFVDAAFSKAAENRLRELRERFGDRKVILGVERLDYTKGIPLKLQAFRRLLETRSHWQGRLVFIQIVVPSREDIQTYREQKRQVEQMVGEINGEFGTPGRVPIHYLHRSIPRTELSALYRFADIGFVSPIRDGMNLIAKEFVACQRDGDGVLVLSEFAGAASELGEAIRVNPWDVDGTAEALNRALELDGDDRRHRMDEMYRRIRISDVHQWARRALRAIERPGHSPSGQPQRHDPEDLAAEIRPALWSASAPLLLLDYDGTLREFTTLPGEASPSPAINRTLERILRYPGATVVIVSGRDRDTLTTWFGHLRIGLVAEHGAWTRLDPDAEWEESEFLAESTWKPYVLPLLNEYMQRTPGSYLEEKAAALVWHYRGADRDLGAWQARELTAHLAEFLANEPAEVTRGAMIVEVRQQGVNKGTAYEHLSTRIGPFDFELAMGDDNTDEDLFAALGPNAFTVHVGDGPSRARASVGSPSSARVFLRALVTHDGQ